MEQKRNFIFFAFAVISFIAEPGCDTSRQEKSPPLAMDEFAQVYASAVILRQGNDSLQARAKVDSLLQARGIRFDEMEQTAAFYERDQEQWRLFWALVVKKLEDEASAVVKTDSVSQSE